MLFAFDKRLLICLGENKRSLRFLILTEFICGFRVPSGKKEKGKQWETDRASEKKKNRYSVVCIWEDKENKKSFFSCHLSHTQGKKIKGFSKERFLRATIT